MGDEGAKRNLNEKSKAPPTDPSEYTILKEGEAEILRHGNDVFYNPAQVVNRDLSIAVIRAFVSKRKEENNIARNKRRAGRVVREDSKSKVASDNGPSNGEAIEEHEVTEGSSKDEQAVDSDTTAVPVENKEMNEPKPLKILEALAASGLRALRYAREVEGIGSVIAVDIDKMAFEACKRNIKLNGSAVSSKVVPELADARVYMLTHQKEFDVVDLDPYGSPSIFLDSAVQSVADGGMLMCTATDMAVLCGNNGEVCYSKYGSYPAKGKYHHEMALRILLACIESHANRYKRYIVPVLSVSVDFYIRVFVRIYTSASATKNTPLKLSYIYQCVGCDSFHLQPLGRTVNKHNSVRYAPAHGPVVPQECSDCGKKFYLAGPIWSAPIHDQEWISSILSNVVSLKDRYPAYPRISAVLTTVSEELLDVPLFLNLHSLSATLKCTSPSAVMFRSAVINAGYRISGTHTKDVGLKTDAPMDVIWDIMRCWVKLHPIKPQPSDQPGSVILSKEPTIQANFARAPSSISKAQAKKIARFLPNPEKHWGPKLKAGRQVKSKHVSLLGSERVNALNGIDQANIPDAKRQKLDNDIDSECAEAEALAS